MKTLIFDLDDTLVPERQAWISAFDSACKGLVTAGTVALREAVFDSARDLWSHQPLAESCRMAGLGSPSWLLTNEPGQSDLARLLSKDLAAWQEQAWQRGLLHAGIHEVELWVKLAGRFQTEFQAQHRAIAGVPEALAALASRFPMGVVTNGFSDLQRDKLDAAELDTFFTSVIISADFGHGKPEPAIFAAAFEALGCEPADAIMIGDNPERDIAGALAAGADAIWLNAGNNDSTLPASVRRIAGLSELPGLFGL